MTEEEKCPKCGEMIEDGGCECYLDDEDITIDSDILEDDEELLEAEDEEVA